MNTTVERAKALICTQTADRREFAATWQATLVDAVRKTETAREMGALYLTHCGEAVKALNAAILQLAAAQNPIRVEMDGDLRRELRAATLQEALRLSVGENDSYPAGHLVWLAEQNPAASMREIKATLDALNGMPLAPRKVDQCSDSEGARELARRLPSMLGV